jgi:RNA polymerase-binding transcription factor DksA
MTAAHPMRVRHLASVRWRAVMVGPRSWKLLVLVVAAGGVVAWLLRARRHDAAAPVDRTVPASARVAERADVVASSDVTDGSEVSHAEREEAPADIDAIADIEIVDIEIVDIDDAGAETATAARTFTAPGPEITADAELDAPADASHAQLDLARIEHDLAGVEAALRRLDDGTYWTDEVTGDPLDEALLLADPVARRNP